MSLLLDYFGHDDPRVDDAIRWLPANQLADGGWNCRTVRSGDRHSSFHTSILALEALAETLAVDPCRTDIGEAIASGHSRPPTLRGTTASKTR